MIRTLIVDDEPLARRGVKLCLKGEPDVDVVGEAENGAQAIAQIATLKPDLVFLDVQMPGLSGFDVLSQLPLEDRPFIIFLTAHNEFAIRAFSERPLDYLLKPLDEQRFRFALDWARIRIRERSAAQGTPVAETRRGEVSSYINRFAVRVGERRLFIPASEIRLVTANRDYVTLHGGARTYLLRETMENLASQLDPAMFCRVHRSVIVATAHVREVRSLESGAFSIRLIDGSEVRGSRRYRERIRTLSE